MKVVVVTLRYVDDFNEHKKLHNQVYEKYTLIPIIKKGKYNYKNKTIHVNKDLQQCVLKEEKSIKIKGTYHRDKLIIHTKSSQYEQQLQFEVKYE